MPPPEAFSLKCTTALASFITYMTPREPLRLRGGCGLTNNGRWKLPRDAVLEPLRQSSLLPHPSQANLFVASDHDAGAQSCGSGRQTTRPIPLINLSLCYPKEIKGVFLYRYSKWRRSGSATPTDPGLSPRRKKNYDSFRVMYTAS